MDVIDAVNQRLAAASNGEHAPPAALSEPQTPGRRRVQSADSRRDIFRNLRVETSLENVETANSSDVNVEINVPTPAKWRQDLLRAGGHGSHGMAPLATNDADLDQEAPPTRPGSSLRSVKTLR